MIDKTKSLDAIPVFISCALIFGLILIFLVPPFQSPDENSHFYRAHHIADGYMMGVKTEDARLGGILPKDLKSYADSFQYLRYNYNSCIDYERHKIYSNCKINEEIIFVDFANVGYYAPTAYLHLSLCVKAVAICTDYVAVQFYTTRLCGLLLWIMLIVLALREANSIQWLIATLALLPSSIVLHSSISADTITNGVCFYLIAMIVARILETEARFSYQDLFVILLLAVMITINKVVYSAIILLCLLVPKYKFPTQLSRERFIVLTSFVLSATLISWYIIAGDTFIAYDHYHVDYRDSQQLNSGVDPIPQLYHVLQSPLRFLQVLCSSFIDSAMATSAHYLGKFGWEHNYLPMPILVLLLIQLFITVFGLGSRSDVVLFWRKRAFIFCVGVTMVLALSTVLYMQWSPVGHGQILSLSGRYFIPIVPVFCFGLYGIKIVKVNFKIEPYVVLISIISLSSTCYAVYHRYWC